MKVYKFAPPYTPGKTKGSTRTTFPETKDHPGVYIIKEDGKVVYVGFSGYSVYKTMYRHFQVWNHRGQEVVSYASRMNRHRYTVRPIICTQAQAYALEKRLIRKYHPRDNVVTYEQMLQEQSPRQSKYAIKVEEDYFTQAKNPIDIEDSPF